MSENLLAKYEQNSAGLHQQIRDLFDQHQKFVHQDPNDSAAQRLILSAPKGEHISINRAQPGSRPLEHFFQSLCMTITRGSNRLFSAHQIDYNYDQYGDSTFRKRIINISLRETEADAAVREQVIDTNPLLGPMESENRFTENMQLAESMGLNNQPASQAEITEAMAYLNGSTAINVHARRSIGAITLHG